MPSKSKTAVPPFMSEEEVRSALSVMLSDVSLRTDPGYTEDEVLYPDHQAPFIEKHISYLKGHPKVNPKDYLSNLRIMIKIRS